ncbi:tape measure protein [Hufsiella ginkgonis]|uniref:Tape measure protein N-terminal domain-containing protein n=1 Tax=Hufsiella ginkgonis TaxID=2695274 RepID=A0A7K1Y172_9SPHI|nr:tape measure protein [Hufsiella ginkgonis]MXV16828.1 hypothetical protein [Hufsiella ginkgonis]
MAVRFRQNGSMNWTASLDDDPLQQTAERIEQRFLHLSQTIQQQGTQFDNFAKKAAQAVTGYFSISSITSFVTSMVAVRGEFQQLEVAYRTILKSKSKADALMAETVKLAAVTPFTLTEVASSTKQLLAYGVGAGEVTSTLERLGNVAAGVSAPIGDIAYLYGTLRTQGRAYQQDINQFTGRGIPIIAELAKVFKVTEGEVRGLVEAGKVGFPQIEEAFKNMTGSAGIFYNLMREQSKTLTGQLSNLSDAWDRMLNDMGESNEGVFNAGIQSAIYLVEHYQDVIDIIKVLIVTYGAYRAAQYIHIALMEAQMTATSLLEVMSARLDKVMKALNATISANPYVLAATAIVALATAFYVYSDSLDAVGEATKEANSQLDIERNKLQQLLDVANNENLSKKARERAIKDLNKLSPEYLGNLNLETLKTDDAKKALDNYVKSLEKSIRLKILNKKLEDLINQENEGPGFGTKMLDLVFNGTTGGVNAFALNSTINNALEQQKVKDQIKKLTEEVDEETSKVTEKVRRDIASIDADIASKKAELAKTTNNAEYKRVEAEINALEREKARITGIATKASKEYNKSLEKKAELIAKLAALNEKYSVATESQEKQKLAEIKGDFAALQAEIDKLNKSKKNKAGALNLNLAPALQKAINDETGLQEVERTKTIIEEQKQLFNDYEAYKLEYGAKNADQRFAEELRGYETYVKYLESLTPVEGDLSVRAKKLKEYLDKELPKAKKEQANKEFDYNMANLKRVLDETRTAKVEEARIEAKFEKDLSILRTKFKGEEFEARKKQLERNRAIELDGVRIMAFEETKIAQDMAKNLFFMTREQLKEQIRNLKNDLKDKSLTPAQKEAGKNALNQAQNLLKSSGGTGLEALFPEAVAIKEALDKISKSFGMASQDFAELSGAFEGVNDELAFTLSTISRITGVVSNVAGKLAAGDLFGAITSGIAGIMSINKRVKEMNAAARAEVQAYYDTAYKGEVQYLALLRERARELAAQEKGTLSNIQKQRVLLATQTSDIDRKYQELFNKLQKQQYVASVDYQHGTWFRKAKVTQNMAGLSGLTYEEIEKLFTEGKLTNGAKVLFEQLQKLKEEGGDVTEALASVAAKAAEIFTGTTAEAITDTIADGFANGFTKVEDFAASTEDIIRKALLNALKYQALEGPIKKLYEQFAKDAESGGALDASEIAAFTAGINKTITDAALFADQLQKATGISLGKVTDNSANKNSLKGALASASQESIDVLSGYMASNRLIQIDMLAIGRQKLASILQIEIYTGRTATNTDRLANIETALVSINKKMDIPVDALRSGGRIP